MGVPRTKSPGCSSRVPPTGWSWLNKTSVHMEESLHTAVDAVNRSCTATGREKCRDSLATTSIDVLAGPVSFNSTRVTPLGEKQNGSFLVVRITARGTVVELEIRGAKPGHGCSLSFPGTATQLTVFPWRMS